MLFIEKPEKSEPLPMISHAYSRPCHGGPCTEKGLADLKFCQCRADASRIAELEAAIEEIYGAGYAMSRGVNGGVTTMCVPIGAWNNAARSIQK